MVRLYQLRGKAGETPERYLFGVAVSINILEAMMQGRNAIGSTKLPNNLPISLREIDTVGIGYCDYLRTRANSNNF